MFTSVPASSKRTYSHPRLGTVLGRGLHVALKRGTAAVGEIIVYTHHPVSVEIVLELVGRRVSVPSCEAARELFLDLFSVTLTLGSVLVDLGEFELHAVDRTVPTWIAVSSSVPLELIDHVLVELDLLDLGVDRCRRRSRELSFSRLAR